MRTVDAGNVRPMCQYVPFGKPTASNPSSRFQKNAG